MSRGPGYGGVGRSGVGERTHPIRLFVGRDLREEIGLSVFCRSVWARASLPVSITTLDERQAASDGTNAFTLSRFRVAQMCDFHGFAIWADGADMLCLADIAELAGLYDPSYAVQVVKRDYRTRHPVKYLGQRNDDYPRKNWSSLMLINCGHFVWRHIDRLTGPDLHRFAFIPDERIGDLPPEWNALVGEDGFPAGAKLAHFTIGLPVWKPYDSWEMAREWREELTAAMSSQAFEQREAA